MQSPKDIGPELTTWYGSDRSRPVDLHLSSIYIQNSLKVDSPQMSRIQQCAAENKIVVVLGYSENIHNSLYIGQAIIGSDGKILTTRKKIKATHMERTIFGDSPGDCLHSVVDTSVGRVGALSCWEHIQPLLKYHTYSQREQIHVAAWPPLFPANNDDDLFSISSEGMCLFLSLPMRDGGLEEQLTRSLGTSATARTYAIESQSFVLHTTTVISQSGIDRMATQPKALMSTPGGGCSAIFGPDGRQLSQPIPSTEEGIIYADLDLNQIYYSKAFVDVCGHYSRPDLLWLGVESGIRTHVRDQAVVAAQEQPE